jgi:oxygen-independent coproporphyrinogen-3 oxidase
MNGHNLRRELDELIKLFIESSEKTTLDYENTILHSKVELLDNQTFAITDIYVNEKSVANVKLKISERAYFHEDKALKWEIRRSAYLALSKFFNTSLNWGILTGIRPSKIVQELLDIYPDQKEVLSILKDFYFVSDVKSHLVLEIAQREQKIISSSKPNSIAIYIGIPFCTTRCLYCSFTSNSITKYAQSIPKYIECLKKEITAVSRMLREKCHSIESIYIGGGTPTSLEADELGTILSTIKNSFDISNLREYTLEAGRPDTITPQKLKIIKQYDIDRISLNPQSMNPDILKLIGRAHSPSDIINSFNLARDMGFKNINMDVIAGLPGDNIESFTNTINQLIALNPESITVHTFSDKRASQYNKEKEKYSLPKNPETMVQTAFELCKEANLMPYYMYRQRNILGNLENVGYSKPGCESIYNVQIMGEKQTIIAIGAGAISKIYYPDENRLERIFNVKSLEDYLSRIDEMIVRKKLMPW